MRKPLRRFFTPADVMAIQDRAYVTHAEPRRRLRKKRSLRCALKEHGDCQRANSCSCPCHKPGIGGTH